MTVTNNSQVSRACLGSTATVTTNSQVSRACLGSELTVTNKSQVSHACVGSEVTGNLDVHLGTKLRHASLFLLRRA